MEDIQYKWAGGLNSSALDIAPNIELPQLKYTKYKLIERQFKLSTGLYSRLTLRLYFSRSLGYYITQIYVPSTLLVVLSWVSFWLDRTAAPARVSLGITTVLTMVTFIWSTNASLPKISYVKGIDVFLVFCFFMTFASVIEYAAVSYIHHKSESKKRKRNQLIQELKEQNEYREQLKLKYLSRKQRQMSNVR
jgi:gamma-aminobutyric acid receptor subunit beta